jgi:hypothetical protein
MDWLQWLAFAFFLGLIAHVKAKSKERAQKERDKAKAP